MINLQKSIRAKFADVSRTIEDFRPEQHVGVDFLIKNPFSALFIDVGMGKSVITLTAIMKLLCRFEVNHVLVIAPRRVALETWPTEIRTWRHTAPLSYVHVREKQLVAAVNKAGRAERKRIADEYQVELDAWKFKSKEERQAELKDWLTTDESKRAIKKARTNAAKIAVRKHFKKNPATIHIINREQVEFLVSAWGAEWPYETVIIDESSCLRDASSKRVKALIKVRAFMRRMHQLTATPAAETYEHLFPQIYLLDLGKRFGRYITHFRKRYFTQNAYTWKWELRPGAEKEISEKIADICLVMKAEDYLNLEAPLILNTVVRLSKEQMQLYRKMQRDYLIKLPNGVEIEAETAAALVQKLLQMASGVIYETKHEEVNGVLKRKRIVHQLHNHKIEALQELVESTRGENLLVAYWHNSSLENLQKAFPKAVVMDEDGKCIKKWNQKKIPMLLIQPSGAAHGLNIQLGGRRIVFYDIPWSLENYVQTVGRLAGTRQLARPEGERLVMIHHLIAQGTLDEDVVEILASKNASQEMLFKLIKKIHNKALQWQNDEKYTREI